MNHRTQTKVTHWIDLDEKEQFDEKGWGKSTLRIDELEAQVVDGSLSFVNARGRRVLKSGELSQFRSDLGSFILRQDPRVLAILRAHGIHTPETERAGAR